jgi:predicted pyridoxine 5'-phosphate oxidase superfamily flavin-nucleotide-binding protein
MPRVERPRMQDYGVPDDLADALPWSWAEERLVRSRNYWVATVDPHGHPHATPVWGLWDQPTERFWFSCAPSSLKARNITTNPHVTVMADDTVEVVSVEGTARLVEPGPREVAEAYARKYEPDAVKAAALTDFVLAHATVEVTPTKAIGIIEREDDFARRATRWAW